jgi:hypothetical protein
MTRIAAWLVLLGLASTASAQVPIQWIETPERGVAMAKRTQRPLLFYVPGDSDSDDSDLEDAQQRSFRDARIRTFVRERYIPVRLTRSNATRQLLSELNVTTGFGMFLLVVTPDGNVVGRIGPSVVAQQPQLLEALVTRFREYRDKLLADQLAPQLENKTLDDGQVRRALAKIREFLILTADDTVAALLQRPDLDDALRSDVYQTLSTLSTKASAEALLTAAATDEAAQRVLKRCTPAAAEHMLPALIDDDGRLRWHVYEAVAAICDIDDTKSRRFWQIADSERTQREIDRVTRRVQQSARAWREQYAAVR